MNETLKIYCQQEVNDSALNEAEGSNNSTRGSIVLPNPVVRKRRLLVFDVETTGLIPSIKQGKKLEEKPFIIQLSFIVFNLLDYTIEKTYNAYIRIQDPERITDQISSLTGITREKCAMEGIPVVDALDAFYQEYMRADYVIAHNISFDKQMILFEVERNYPELEKRGAHLVLNLFNPLFCKVRGIENYCTMMSSIHICNILTESKEGSNRKPYKKFPKLTELYYTLFRSNPENLHNAMVDTLVCLRCFLKIKMDHDIHENKYNFMLQMVMQIV